MSTSVNGRRFVSPANHMTRPYRTSRLLCKSPRYVFFFQSASFPRSCIIVDYSPSIDMLIFTILDALYTVSHPICEGYWSSNLVCVQCHHRVASLSRRCCPRQGRRQSMPRTAFQTRAAQFMMGVYVSKRLSWNGYFPRVCRPLQACNVMGCKVARIYKLSTSHVSTVNATVPRNCAR
jgi:hypothetical protein